MRFKFRFTSNPCRPCRMESLEPRLPMASDLPGIYGNATAMVEDINLASTAAPRVLSAVQLDDKLVYSAYDGIGDIEIWSTDGVNNTRLVEINANRGSVDALGVCCKLSQVGDFAYMIVNRLDEGAEEGMFASGEGDLWQTDGTTEGSKFVSTLTSWDSQTHLNQTYRLDGDDLLLMLHGFGGHAGFGWFLTGPLGTETPERYGPSFVISFRQAVKDLVRFNDQYYFLGANDDSGTVTFGLWQTDPTKKETVLVKRFSGSDVDVGGPLGLTVFGDSLYLAASDGPLAPNHLWKSDGTNEGTTQVHSVEDPTAFTVTADGLLFQGNLNEEGRTWLVTDDGEIVMLSEGDERSRWKQVSVAQLGERENLRLLDFDVEQLNEWSGAPHVIQHGDLFFFSLSEQWVTDGTNQGTRNLGRNIHAVGDFNGAAVFAQGRQLLTLNSATLELTPLTQLPDTRATRGSNPLDLVASDDGIFFLSKHDNALREVANTSNESKILWVGNEFDTFSELEDEQRATIAPVGENVFVALSNGGLHVHNRGTGMTEQLATFEHGAVAATSLDEDFYLVRGSRQWSGAAVDQYDIWSSDGTTNGTRSLDLPNPELNRFSYWEPDFEVEPVIVNGKMFFVTEESELHEVDLDAGTRLTTQAVHGMTAIDDTVFFLHKTRDSTDLELWKHDGIEANLVTSVDAPSFIPPIHRDIEGIQETIFFAGGNGELWKSDGTAANTELVAQFDAVVSDFAVYGEQLFFVASDEAHGSEIWVTDGTSQGTHIAVDIRPGSLGSFPKDLTISGEQLYFSASDGQYGRELWRADVGSLVGDIDGNDQVNFEDFQILARNFGKETNGGSATGDVNQDGMVSFADFLLLSTNYDESD